MTATVRIRQETHEALRDLREQTGEAMPDLVARAVDQFYRSLLIAETNVGYAALREDAAEWAAEREELDLWDDTLPDGLDD